MKIITLIGMPGSGKTTAGRLLAQKLGWNFVDIDSEIERKSGKSISEIFETGGEKEFRKIETETLSEVFLGLDCDTVAATGGGIVKMPENIRIMKSMSTVVFLARDTELLSRDNRPLSRNADLSKMYGERLPLYEAAKDFTVENGGKIEDAVLTLYEFITGSGKE